MSKYLTAALYKFVSLPDYRELQAPLLAVCERHRIKGTLLLAEEGINGTIAGLPDDIRQVLDYLRHDAIWQGRLANLEHKESWAARMPFYRMKVRLKQEIVKLGVPEVKPSEMAGTYVKPEDWNTLISDPDVILVDTRNDYEVAIGTFKGAVNPNTKSFTELPEWVEQEKALREKPKVAMFCTGGIRCEKSTAYLRSQGFDEVYHLQGGILKYLETVPEDQSLWHGECGRTPIAALRARRQLPALSRQDHGRTERGLCRTSTSGRTGRAAQTGPYRGEIHPESQSKKSRKSLILKRFELSLQVIA
jgi:UPF0176 protein